MNKFYSVVLYIVGYLVTYFLQVMAGFYFSPMWGGEATISFVFISASALPGFILAIIFHNRSLGIGWVILGSVTMLLIIPIIKLDKIILNYLSISSIPFYLLFYAITNLLITYLILNVIHKIGTIIRK